MKLPPFIALSLIALPHIVHAALPPTAESMRRIKAIMDSKEVYETLGSTNWIKSITEENGLYTLKSDQCTLTVTVETTPLSSKNPGMVGPPILDVKIGNLKCINKNR